MLHESPPGAEPGRDKKPPPFIPLLLHPNNPHHNVPHHTAWKFLIFWDATIGNSFSLE